MLGRWTWSYQGASAIKKYLVPIVLYERARSPSAHLVEAWIFPRSLSESGDARALPCAVAGVKTLTGRGSGLHSSESLNAAFANGKMLSGHNCCHLTEC